MTTLKDIAKIAGVSIASVSYVINGTKELSEETTKRINEAINQTSFSPHTLAKSLRMGKTLTVGVLVEDIRGLPIADIVNGVEESLEDQGYQMILNDLHMLEKLYNQYDQIGDYKDHINNSVKQMLRSQVDGIIYVGLHDRHIDNLINPIEKPFVYAYSHGSKLDHYVTYNNYNSAMDAVNYLIDHSHRNIAVIGGHPDSFPTQERMKGYLTSMTNAGLTVRDDYIYYGDWGYESGMELIKKLLALRNPPSAVFVMNDLMAAGCINTALKEKVRIPQDLSIIGFDNREIASYLPVPLTTIQLPNKEIGHISANMLLELTEGELVKMDHIILPCKLIERESVSTFTG